jgi:hypothetical protein
VEDQNAAVEFSIGAVCSAFKDFPMIQHLELTGGIDHGAKEPTPQDFIDFKKTWPKIGLAPHRKGNKCSHRQIFQALTAALSINKSLTSLSLIGVDCDVVNFASDAKGYNDLRK